MRWGFLVMLALVVSPSVAGALVSERTSSDDEDAVRYFAEGLRHQEAKRFAEAISAYEQSLKHDARQAEALSNIGFCYKSLGRYHKAITYYKDAIHLDPQLAEAHEYLGEAYLGLGKLDLAKREYQRLLELDPEEAEELKEKIDDYAAGAAQPPHTPTPLRR